MCVIKLNLNFTTPNGTTITNSQGRYRKFGTTTWTNFIVNLSDPKTPNITELGQYELEVNVVNSLKVVSAWASSTFEITSNCNQIITSINCGENLEFSSQSGAGTYYIDVDLGGGTGNVTLDYFSGNIPDRFKIHYNGVVVADSKFVGGYLTGDPPNASISSWLSGGGTNNFVGSTYTNIMDKTYQNGDFVNLGTSKNYVVTQNDVAEFGSTSGTGSISFNKSTPSPTKMTVEVISLASNTGWNFSVNCV